MNCEQLIDMPDMIMIKLYGVYHLNKNIYFQVSDVFISFNV